MSFLFVTFMSNSMLLKCVFLSLTLLHVVWQVEPKNNDVQLTDFIESEFLGEHVIWCCKLRELLSCSLLDKLLSEFYQYSIDKL